MESNLFTHGPVAYNSNFTDLSDTIHVNNYT